MSDESEPAVEPVSLDDQSASETFSEEYDGTVPDERTSVNAEDEPGAQLGNKIAGALGRFAGNITLMGSRLLPGSAKMWRGLLKTSYKGLYKSSGSIDAIGHIIVAGEVRHIPLTFDHERGRYKTLADDPEWWDTSGQYQDRYQIGPVPTVFASATANDVGDHVQAEVSKALDLGKDAYLYEDAEVSHVEMDVPDGSSPGEAIADGGNVSQQYNEFVTVENPGVLSDRLVDLGWDGADARVVSWDDYTETYPETADSEKMKEERQIGRLMETDGDMSSYAMKMLLIAGAIIIGALAVVLLGPELLGSGGGGGGGGGGSVIPLFATALGLV